MIIITTRNDADYDFLLSFVALGLCFALLGNLVKRNYTWLGNFNICVMLKF